MGYNDVHNAERLLELQALPLERKIQITQTRIIEWALRYGWDNVYISFSGGKDSTVLMDIARKVNPAIHAVYINTGLEYPEVRQFALSFQDVEEIRPVYGQAGKLYGKKPSDVMTFRDVVRIYGYPILTKEISATIAHTRNVPDGKCGERMRGEYMAAAAKAGKNNMWDYSKYAPVLDLPIRISDRCCLVSKERPAHRYKTRTGRRPIAATMTAESMRRRLNWLKQGCNAFDGTHPISNPMSFWTEQDVLQYIKRYNLRYASVYGEIVQDEKSGELRCTGCDRTGCIFCAYGAHRETEKRSRFKRLAQTHPKLYEHCIGGGGLPEKPVVQIRPADRVQGRRSGQTVEPKISVDAYRQGPRNGAYFRIVQ